MMKLDDIHNMIRKKQNEIKGRATKVKIRSQGEEIAGKTNASNPTTLAKLIDTFNAYSQSTKTMVKADPRQPRHVKPDIEDRYHEMGAWLDMCPYELKDIMEHKYSTDNVLVRESLKKLIIAVKMSNEVGEGPTVERLKISRELYERDLSIYERNVEVTNAYNKQLKEDQLEKRNSFYQAWGDILIDLTTKLQRNSKLKELAEWDQWMVKALSASVSTDVCKVKKDGTVVLDFNNARFIDSVIIGKLPDLASRMKSQDEENKRREMYCRAPIQVLLDHLWSCTDDVEFSEVAEVIRWRKEEVEAGHGEDVNYVLRMYEQRRRHRSDMTRKLNDLDADMW